jgi:dihydropyrimidinase
MSRRDPSESDESLILVAGGTVVGPRLSAEADVLVGGSKIVDLGRIEPSQDTTVIDAKGMLVIPGAVDVHTHLDMDLGAVNSSDDFATGTIAAACGGTTTIVDFATAYRGQTARHGLETWHAKAAGKSMIDYSFHMSLTELPVPADEIVAEMVECGITSFKLYMTYPERLMVSDEVISQVMTAAEHHGALVCLHCEDDATVARLRDAELANGRVGPRSHPLTRPPRAEADAVVRAARMAEETGAACYVVHLSSAPALEEVRHARERGVELYAETCPQYLYLSAERYERAPEEAQRYVCAPPLRDQHHREELWEGLRQGHLQVVATDHCPFTSRDKKRGTTGRGWSNFTEIPGGLPGIETRLSLIYQQVSEGRLSREQWVDRCCTTPAQLFGLHPSKGELAVGADADIVVFDPRATRPLVPERLHMNLDYSPYEDLVVSGWPSVVLSRGRVVARDGNPLEVGGWGRFVHRGPSGSLW